jgi:UDP-glucose 4-epimerase
LGKHGDTFIPRINAVNVQDLAIALIDGRKIEIKEIGIRPGEKIHEILISEEEKYITKIHSSGKFFIISSLLPEISIFKGTHLESEYSSNEKNMSIDEIKKLLKDKKLTIEDSNLSNNEEMLR